MKLYNSYPGNPLTDICAITAHLGGIQFEEVFLTPEQKADKEWAAKNATKKFPFLETSEGGVFESTAICRHFARIAEGKNLYGANHYESSLVD